MNFGSWITQLFYDIIGRIVPGAVLMVISFFLFPPLRQAFDLFEQTGLSNTVFVFTAVAVSYILGIILSGLAYALLPKERCILKLCKTFNLSNLCKLFKLCKKEKQAKETDPDNQVKNPKNKSQSYVYDYILFHNQQVGSRLAKLSAERNLARILIIGCAIIIFAYAIIPSYPYIDYRFWFIIIVLLIIIVASFRFLCHIIGRAKKLMNNNFNLIEHDLSFTNRSSNKL